MVANTATRLKQIMDERGLKQSDIIALAKPFCDKYNVKLGKSDISQFVSGKVIPGQWKLTILGLALNVSESWLMGLDVSRERAVEKAAAADPEEQKNKPASEVDSGLAEITAIFSQLSPDNRAKLLELSRLYLDAQRKTE